MLRLEKRGKGGKIHLRFYDSGFALEAGLVKALILAFLFHFSAFLIFEIYPFKIEDEGSHSLTASVMTDLRGVTGGSRASCDLRNVDRERSLFLKLFTSLPSLPDLPIEKVEWPKWIEEELEGKDAFLIKEEERLLGDLCRYLKQSDEEDFQE